ncbi:MAG: hypothetical protein HY670_01240 [Chloroflexi bacterium]|nr:hypothetical protein [Chloroflexota bacterium]
MPVKSKAPLTVTIAASRQAESCEAACGLDWTAAENAALARQRVKERFGERVQMEFLDLSSGGPAAPLAERVKREELSLPLLLVDGAVRISGNFDFRLLLDTIDAGLEMRQ